MNETRFEQIEDYLNGELTGKALAEFEAQLNADPALQAEVELHRDIDIALIDKQEIPFVQTLRDIHTQATVDARTVEPAPLIEEPAPDPTPPLRPRILRFAMAAAAAILLAVFTLPILFPSQNAMQFSENTIGDAPTVDVWRSNDEVDPMTEKLITAYQKIEQKKYTEAIPELNQIYEATDGDEAALGLGYCHLQVKNYDNAIELFEKIQAKNSILNDTVSWYLAHSYLRKGDVSSGKNILQKIILSENVTLKRREQAKSLLNSLEKIN